MHWKKQDWKETTAIIIYDKTNNYLYINFFCLIYMNIAL